MVGRHNSAVVNCVFALLGVAFVGACDVESEQPEWTDEPAAQEQSPDLDWAAVPIPALASPALGLRAPAASTASVIGPWTIESFHFDSGDFIALSQEPGNLFAPFPADVEPLPPELSSGFFLGFEFLDANDQIVGFGSEQEILDFEAATGQTTYTLTFPERGALTLVQEEEFAYLFDIVDDMVADQEFVRVFDPPVVRIHTVPGSARILGGTGEFHHAIGLWREISILYKLDLLTGQNEVGIILQVAHL